MPSRHRICGSHRCRLVSLRDAHLASLCFRVCHTSGFPAAGIATCHALPTVHVDGPSWFHRGCARRSGRVLDRMEAESPSVRNTRACPAPEAAGAAHCFRDHKLCTQTMRSRTRQCTLKNARTFLACIA